MRFRKLTAALMATFMAVAFIVSAQDYQQGGAFQPNRDMQLLGRVDVTGSLFPPRADSPAQTLDGSIVWDNDTDLLTVGTGASRTIMVDTTSAQSLASKTLTTAGNITGAGFIKSTAPGLTGGLGYATGAGCAVTQITNRSTGVTCAGVSGAITTDTTSLAALAQATFIVTNSSVAIGDVVIVTARSGQTAATSIPFVTTVTAGTFSITLFNISNAATADTGAMIINFAVIKAVSS